MKHTHRKEDGEGVESHGSTRISTDQISSCQPCPSVLIRVNPCRTLWRLIDFFRTEAIESLNLNNA